MPTFWRPSPCDPAGGQGMVLSVAALSEQTPRLPSEPGEGEKPSSKRLQAAGEARFLAEVLLDARSPRSCCTGFSTPRSQRPRCFPLHNENKSASVMLVV